MTVCLTKHRKAFTRFQVPSVMNGHQTTAGRRFEKPEQWQGMLSFRSKDSFSGHGMPSYKRCQNHCAESSLHAFSETVGNLRWCNKGQQQCACIITACASPQYKTDRAAAGAATMSSSSVQRLLQATKIHRADHHWPALACLL